MRKTNASTLGANDNYAHTYLVPRRQAIMVHNKVRFRILALYKFVSPKWTSEYVQTLKDELEIFLREQSVFGNLLLSEEGINGTICYPFRDAKADNDDDDDDDDAVCAYFVQTFPGIRLRVSYNEEKNVFHRLRIRIKKEIVTLGIAQVDPCQKVGTYVPPGPAWHALLQDPDTLVIDTRNDYEVRLGTFQNAVNPRTDSFTEFPRWFDHQMMTMKARKPKKIAMFCTGGIRCEKASSYCLDHRVVAESNIPVYHLQGGILAYLDQVPPDQSLWTGECFVFDQRTSVGHGLKPSSQYTLCHACRHPLSPEDRTSSDFQLGIACPYCIHSPDKEARRDRYEERQKQCVLSENTAFPHIHDAKQIKTV